MKCPTDGTDLVMSDRQGIEIDYCPKCRGVWLDRGELDKIIERSAAAQPQQAAPPPPAQPQLGYPPQQPYPQQSYPQYREDSKGYGYDPRYHKKRKSLLGEIFDFD